uniref:R-spondin Fu-CRD domain-containing protein n=1 Tax=Poecilia mexicana TaxID=48701 RepID=A0A3B3YYY4_9TELE
MQISKERLRFVFWIWLELTFEGLVSMAGGSSGCQQSGCLTCSDYNGCLSCKPRLFMHLERIGMKQIGVCMTSCPPGFYGTRSPERNTCTKCRSECDSCFNKNFCTRCRAGFYLHLGKCLDSCPVGMVHSDAQRECVPMHCEVGEWSEWSPCSRSGRTCGFRRGQETRTRQVQQYPSPFGNPCPEISEVKECLVKKKRCQGQHDPKSWTYRLKPPNPANGNCSQSFRFTANAVFGTHGSVSAPCIPDRSASVCTTRTSLSSAQDSDCLFRRLSLWLQSGQWGGGGSTHAGCCNGHPVFFVGFSPLPPPSLQIAL